MNIENIESESMVVSVLFHDTKKELIDIDHLFRITNRSFAKIIGELNLPLTFDFSKTDNKKIYMHAFILALSEFLRERERDYTPYFYSNTLTKDSFRNGIIKRIKSLFGFLIWEDVKELKDFSELVKENDCNCYAFSIFLQSFKKAKSFKQMKKYAEKQGLTFLGDVYLQDLSNKMQMFG